MQGTAQTEEKNTICPREFRLYLEKTDGKCRSRGSKAAEPVADGAAMQLRSQTSRVFAW